MNNQGVLAAELEQHPRDRLDEVGREDADQLAFRPRGIGQGPQHVEQRAHAELLPYRHDLSHRRMEHRREQEGDTNLVKAPPERGRVARKRHAQSIQDVGRAGPARHRPVAVLGDASAASRRDQRGRGRNVEGAPAVAAGAAGVDHARTRVLDARGPRPHRPGSAGDLTDRLSLRRQRDEERALPHLRECAVHQAAEQFLHRRRREILAGDCRSQQGGKVEITHFVASQ